MIEAIAEGDYDRAADVAAAVFDGNFDSNRIRSRYDDLAKPDAVHSVECVEETPAENMVAEFSEVHDVEATEAVSVEYSFDVTIGSANRETSTRATAVKIDDEWTAWLDDTLIRNRRRTSPSRETEASR